MLVRRRSEKGIAEDVRFCVLVGAISKLPFGLGIAPAEFIAQFGNLR